MSGIFGSQPQAPQVQGFTFPNEGGAASGALQNINALGSAPFSDITALTGLVPGLTTNLYNAGNFGPMPSGAGGITTANAVAGPGAALGQGSINTAANFQGEANALVPYANNLINMGFDPQNALYNQTLANTTQQSLAAQANAGLNTSPYGGSVTGATIGNFNTGWENTQTQRAATAEQGASSLLGGAFGLASGAQGLGTAGAQGAVQSALLPWATGQQIGGQSLQDLAQGFQLGTAGAGLPQMSIQDYLNYLQGGTSAMSVTNQGQEALSNWELANQQQQFNMWSKLGSGLVGGAFGGLGAFNMMGGMGGGGGMVG